MEAVAFYSFAASMLRVAEQNAAACALMGFGALILFWGIRWGVHRAQQLPEDPPKALAIMRGFRLAVIGLCLSAYGAGWWWRIDWLMTVAIVICLEEIAESSFYIAALKREPM